MFRVKIDLPALQAHLADEDRSEVSEADAIRFLVDSGFVRDGDWWIVREGALGALEPIEVSDIELVDGSDDR